MIQPASLIPFGVVFFALTWALSLLACAAVLLGRGHLRRLGGPRVERRASALALLLPPLLGLVVTAALLLRSLAGAWIGLPDHCPAHGHHLHLCLYHGAVWADQPWAVATLAGASTLLLARLARRGGGLWRARAAVRSLLRVGRPLEVAGRGIVLAPSDIPFCFVAGIAAPRIFVSSAAWDCLAPDERRAVLEHEQAHVAQGDLWRRTALGAMALFGFPVLVRRVLATWDHATERLCDRHSAQEVGEPTIVAAALVALARAGARPLPCAAAFVSPCTLTDRVEAILGHEPDGREPARFLGIAAALGVAAVVVGTAVLAEPLHHALETVLGSRH